jgi:hypothetical protein
MAFTWTESYVFVPLPAVAGIFLGVLVVRAPEVDEEGIHERRQARRRSVIQLLVSCGVLLIFVIVSAVLGWGRGRLIGYSIMLATLLVLAGLGYRIYRYTHRKMAIDQPDEPARAV